MSPLASGTPAAKRKHRSLTVYGNQEQRLWHRLSLLQPAKVGTVASARSSATRYDEANLQLGPFFKPVHTAIVRYLDTYWRSMGRCHVYLRHQKGIFDVMYWAVYSDLGLPWMDGRTEKHNFSLWLKVTEWCCVVIVTDWIKRSNSNKRSNGDWVSSCVWMCHFSVLFVEGLFFSSASCFLFQT